MTPMTPTDDAIGHQGPSNDTRLPRPAAAKTEDRDAQSFVDRLYSFRFTFGTIAAFILLYTLSIRGLEGYLHTHFDELMREAIEVTNYRRPIASEIQQNIDVRIMDSLWAGIGGVDVSPMVIGRDGSTLIYVAGGPPKPLPERYVQSEILAEAHRLLPATAYLTVSVPHNSLLANSILIFYAAISLQVLWFRNLANARRQRQLLEQARAHRVQTETRTKKIESELDQMRRQLHAIEPTEPEHISEVNQLREERKSLEGKLAALETRELELRDTAAHASALGRDIGALEDLLEEASEDLAARDDVIRELEKNLKRASKDVATQEAGRVREADSLARRFGTLYVNLEIDDRALQDIVALRDEAMKLKCGEKLKRLNDEADNMSVRRKVGGIPPHLTVFEMGFAGKGRIYYMKGNQRRFRILNVGAKNTQNAAIEYLRKL